MTLKQWAEKHGKEAVKDLRKRLDITRAHMHQLLNDGYPSRKLAKQIEKELAGEVSRLELLYPEDESVKNESGFLRAQLAEEQEKVRELVEVVERLGSRVAMTASFALSDSATGDELRARIIFAEISLAAFLQKTERGGA